MLFNHERALAKMDEYGVDAIVAATPRNFYYASEYWTTVAKWGHQENIFAAIVPRDTSVEAEMVIPEGFFGNIFFYPTWIPKVRAIEMMNTSIIAHEPEPVRLEPLQSATEEAYAERVVGPVVENLIVGVADALRAMGLAEARVAFDDLRLAEHVKSKLDALKVVDGHDLWIDIRKVKTPEEVDRLRIGAQINQDAIEHIIPMIKPNVVWGEVAEAYREYVRGHDAEVLAPERALQFGAEYEGEYYPDMLFGDINWRVREGRPIIFESWGTYKDYHFDFSRTIFIGEPTQEYIDTCNTIHEAWKEGIQSKLRPGITTRDLFKGGMELLYDTKVPTPKKTLPFFHSIGLDIIEHPSGYPSFGQLKPWELEENTVLNCEFLYFGHTLDPFHIESTFVVTQDGAECFQTMPEGLRVLA
jgi:Xaa-Pro aminopeptidase